MSRVTIRGRRTRLALATTASLLAFGASAGAAWAAHDPGDAAVVDTAGLFRLVPANLEPGCYLAGATGSPVASHIDVTQVASEAHVSVLNGARFSIDQVLVPGMNVRLRGPQPVRHRLEPR